MLRDFRELSGNETEIKALPHRILFILDAIDAQMSGPPYWLGIYDDHDRLMVGINYNIDMGDAWEHADDPYYPEPMTGQAYRLGINYVIYAMTH